MPGRRIVAVAAAFLLAVGGGVGALLWYGGRAPPPDKSAWRGVASVTLKLPPAEPAPPTPPPQATATPALPTPPPEAAPPTPAPLTTPPVATPPPPPVPSVPRPSPPAAAPKPPTTQAAAPPSASAPKPTPPVTPAPSFPMRAGEPKLAPPDPALGERVKDGVLPMIARDGRQPWQVYARPFDKNDKRPRVAVLLTNMGLSASATEQAIRNLPGGVTLAFAPFAERLPDWIDLARRSGHEVLLSLPMEPEGYPRNDPGPKTLLTSLSEAENQDRLDWVLTRAVAYAGVTNLSGGRFAASTKDLQPVLKSLRQRGLLYVERGVGRQTVAGEIARELGLPFAAAQVLIDADPARVAIDSRLTDLERAAKRDGSAVGLALPYPVTQERLAVWGAALEQRGIALAPISAVVAAGK